MLSHVQPNFDFASKDEKQGKLLLQYRGAHTSKCKKPAAMAQAT